VYKRMIIYYLTGTGNALTAGRWLADLARKQGVPAELIPIDRFKKPPKPPSGRGLLIGFLYPTHGFSPPWYMLKFMIGFPRGGHHLFCLNTYGGTKIGRLHLPGLSGIALILPALIFFLKGYRVRGLVSINLPSNWISLHPGLTKSAVASLARHCRKKINRYAKALLSGRRSLQGLLSLPIDLAVSPISLGYMLVGRFWLAKMYLATSDCNGCGICESHCPMNALVMKKGRPFWTFHCESCMRCINICPRKAIQVSHMFTAISLYGIYGLLFPLLLYLFLQYNETMAAVMSSRSQILSYIRSWIFLSILFLAYRMAHSLTRFRPFDFFFARLSLTRLPFWRRYLAPGLSVKDFKIKKQ
jgi:NAD-dependent dihydropyrimidine dehydrogenase PreA subunit